MVDLKQWILGSRAVGVEFELSGDEIRWRAKVLRFRNGNIEQGSGYSSENSSFDKLKLPRSPLVLLVNGKNVIAKKVPLADDFSMLSRVIPASRQKEFVYQLYPIDEKYAWIVLVLKVDLDRLLELVQSSRCFIEGIWLGMLAVETIFPVIESIPSRLYAGSCTLQVEANHLVDVVNEGGQAIYSLKGGESIASEHIPAYTAAILYFSQIGPGILYRYFPVYRSNSFKYHRIFKLLAVSTLLLVSCILFVNNLVGNKRSEELEKYKKQIGMNQNLLVVMDSLERKQQEYNNYILSKGLTEESYFAYYIDRVAGLVPEGMRLFSLQVNVPKRKVKEGEIIEYRQRDLLIKGITPSAGEVDLFLKKLQAEKWVTRINYHDYSAREGRGMFTINLEFNKD